MVDLHIKVEIRLNNARKEVCQLSNYRYAIINQDGDDGLSCALQDLLSIVHAERHNTIRFSSTL